TKSGDESGKIYFIFDDDEATRFYPNKENNYIWHFWGEPDELTGGFKVIGTHESNQADEKSLYERMMV
ncbi:hypothetical protein P4475_08435, partial [Halalkalibacterium halodurans]|nr:hypothetical protein [Halalkalibacterium halodurans]